MKAVVIYKSKTGFTKKYAEWIAEDLSADIFEGSKITADMLSDYDSVIYGGGLYAAGINGVKLITQNLDKLKDKKIVVFATGASPSNQKVISDIANKNFTPEEQKIIKFFYLRGGFDYNKLKFPYKAAMTLMKWTIKSKKESERTDDESGMLEAYDKPVDFTDKKYIDEIISYINS
ncbi:MAG: flavodoxin domain-containing protein [Deltaproteobacteria bacterium]